MLDTSIQVKTDHFDGPFGLLLLLIQKEEMSIKDLDLTKITQQYLAYLAQMQELNFDVAGDYLYLAATLLLLKSNTAISEEESHRLQEDMKNHSGLHITSEAELVRRLEELQHFQKMGQLLWQLPKKGHDIFVKPKVNRKAIVNSILTPVEMDKLTEAMIDIMIRERRKYTVLKRDRLSIKEKLVFLKEYLGQGKSTHLEELIEKNGGPGIDNTVITFISLLELARLKKIKIFQNEAKGNVYIDVVGTLADFNVESADGFEEEGGEEAFPELEEKPQPMATLPEEEVTSPEIDEASASPELTNELKDAQDVLQ